MSQKAEQPDLYNLERTCQIRICYCYQKVLSDAVGRPSITKDKEDISVL